jgi:hypothetical protein
VGKHIHHCHSIGEDASGFYTRHPLFNVNVIADAEYIQKEEGLFECIDETQIKNKNIFADFFELETPSLSRSPSLTESVCFRKRKNSTTSESTKIGSVSHSTRSSSPKRDIEESLSKEGDPCLTQVSLYRKKRSYLQKRESKITCRCHKSKCLKLYCECFRNGKFCGLDCECEDCRNIEEYQSERLLEMQKLKKKNKLFKQTSEPITSQVKKTLPQV